MFKLKFSSIKTVGATALGGLWALEWAWHITEQTCAAQESQESACLIPVL